MHRIRKTFNLIKLYNQAYLSKRNTIVLVISFILMIFIFVSSLELGFSNAQYDLNYAYLHKNYFYSAFQSVRYLNGMVLVFFISQEESICIKNLSLLLQARFGKSHIYIAKIISIGIFLLCFLTIEFGLFFFIPSITYRHFTISIINYKIIMDMFIESFILLLYGFIFVKLLKVPFAAIIPFVLFLVRVSFSGTPYYWLDILFPILHINGIFLVEYNCGIFYSTIYLVMLLSLGFFAENIKK